MAERHNGFEAPGTFVMALIFTALFILVYFVNFKWLAGIWGVR